MSNEIHRLQCEIAKVRRENSNLKRSLYEQQRMQQYYYYKGLRPEQYEEALKEWYFEKTGKLLNLNNPQTYNEKIQWMKLFNSTQLKADLSDKYKVRDYVREHLGEEYLIPLLGVWSTPDEIPFESLPKQFVIKANHGSGYNIIVRDKTKLDIASAKSKLLKWLCIDYAFMCGFEMHYNMIDRKIIAEEYIENLNGDVFDYKVFCFNGKAKYIMIISERSVKPKMAFYDTEWNRMDFTYSFEPMKKTIPKPDELAQLIYAAETLAKGFPHVRVDFYILNSGEIKFGEMTFTSASGNCKWDPPEYDRILGDMIDISNIEKDIFYPKL